MGRISDAFGHAKDENRAALVIYLCAGDPDLATTAELVVAAAESGADVIELGMPFSDPSADGPSIQRASERALGGGATLAGVLNVVRKVRARTEVPILLFGYYNPILRYGEAKLAADASDAGADGFLVVDLPPEEAASLRDPAMAHGMDFVPLLAPTSNDTRVDLAASVATSFLYYVSMTGITGAKATDLGVAAERARALQTRTEKPVAIGFGVKTRDDVAKAASGAAGVVVGSAVVNAVEAADSPDAAIDAVRALVSDLASGLGR